MYEEDVRPGITLMVSIAVLNCYLGLSVKYFSSYRSSLVGVDLPYTTNTCKTDTLLLLQPLI